MQRALSVIYPDQCLLCDELVERSGGLCPKCRRDAPFIFGHCCDACGSPLLGEEDGAEALCDDCHATPRPWARARAALVYQGAARKLVLSIKHGDRLEMVGPAAEWMVHAGSGVLNPGSVLVPVPIHWSRRVTRRYNQSAELCRAIGRVTGLPMAPHALIRQRLTPLQNGMSFDARFENQSGSIAVARRHSHRLVGIDAVLVDDVMTSGATLTEAANVLLDAGARQVSCLVLARAVKTP